MCCYFKQLIEAIIKIICLLGNFVVMVAWLLSFGFKRYHIIAYVYMAHKMEYVNNPMYFHNKSYFITTIYYVSFVLK